MGIIRGWLERKGDTCECCGMVTRKLFLDHNHKTGRIRAWLCFTCNRLEGSIANGKFDMVRRFIEERDK